MIISGIAWVVDRVASKTSTPVGEERLARALAPISYPSGGLLLDDVTVLAQDVPGADDVQIRKLLRRAGHGIMTSVRLRARARRRSGVAIGVVRGDRVARSHVVDPRTGSPATRRSRSWSPARVKGGEAGQTLDEMVEAQLVACRLEVNSDIVGEIESAARRPLPRGAAAVDGRDRIAGSSAAASKTG